jgi:hypothetical protein
MRSKRQARCSTTVMATTSLWPTESTHALYTSTAFEDERFAKELK